MLFHHKWKLKSKTKLLMPMATILISNWDIYSWHHLVHTFVWLNIISCQSLNHLTLFPNPSFMRCNINPRCEITFAFVKRMLRILHANTLMCEVACSQSVTLSYLHSFVISCIVMTNCAKALFHWGWWNHCVIRPYNGTHREFILLHVHEPIKFHDPIITFKHSYDILHFAT